MNNTFLIRLLREALVYVEHPGKGHSDRTMPQQLAADNLAFTIREALHTGALAENEKLTPDDTATVQNMLVKALNEFTDAEF